MKSRLKQRKPWICWKENSAAEGGGGGRAIGGDSDIGWLEVALAVGRLEAVPTVGRQRRRRLGGLRSDYRSRVGSLGSGVNWEIIFESKFTAIWVLGLIRLSEDDNIQHQQSRLEVEEQNRRLMCRDGNGSALGPAGSGSS
ncbi:hypothetical protein Salat_2511600 [Sesamum alatum]|uniref:Uncharacterized protein n=1 Tax=Sesamum alatum TaxID=300844 RepID=A0AAE1XRY6_9LAMI|nr:hypothetical protein Salat_2511600 [Sesamum alatum]